LKELGETAYEIGEIDKGDKGLILNE